VEIDVVRSMIESLFEKNASLKACDFASAEVGARSF
jgi:hypothetical protein